MTVPTVVPAVFVRTPLAPESPGTGRPRRLRRCDVAMGGAPGKCASAEIDVRSVRSRTFSFA